MINEENLKKFLYSLMVWTEVTSRPDVKKMLEEQLNEAIHK